MNTISISISDSFEGGNIRFVKTRRNENDPTAVTDVILQIKPDPYTDLEDIAHMQYFCFRALISGIPTGQTARIQYIIENAHAVSYPEAWVGTSVCYSPDINDDDAWRRNTDTFYTQGQLTWEQLHTSNGSIFFSFFPPYSYNRHLSLISDCAKFIGDGSVLALGQSLDGRDIECIRIGQGNMKCWIIHRQHPGETMAEHYAEGLLTRLLGIKTNGQVDEQVLRLKQMYTFYIVPCMCPDGAVRGHLRTNACGANLNREWTNKGEYKAPTMHRSPEVYCVLNTMDETGVDLFLDIHGDEELPYNFMLGANLTPKWGKRMESLHGAFLAAYCRSNSDMQQRIGYPPPESAQEALDYMNTSTNQVSNRFDCLGMGLEQPFKDCWSNPDPMRGWTPERARKLAASLLDPIEYIHPYLRDETDFWNRLPKEDAYVETTDNYQEEPNSETEEFKMLKKRFYSDVREIHKKPASTSSIILQGVQHK